jgi:large subunit ribosomal protein L10
MGRFYFVQYNYMALTKTQKQAVLNELTEVADAKSIVFVGFRKLNVKDVTEFRRGLRKEDVSYRVAKKTLLRRALDVKGFSGTMPELPGELGVAWGEDPLTAAREVYAFAKTHKENLEIVGGVFEGQYKDAASMMTIATIPPREVLLAQIAFLLKSPLQRLAIAVNEVAKTKN